MSIFSKILVLTTFALPALANDWSYYSGEEKWYNPADNFNLMVTHPKLMKRRVLPNQKIIQEESVIEVYGETRVMIFDIKVSENSFSIDHSVVKGKGQLYGRPWNWTSWTSVLDTPDGGKVKVADYLSKDGLRATGELYDKDGRLVVIMESKLNSVSEATYKKTKEALLLKSKLEQEKPRE